MSAYQMVILFAVAPLILAGGWVVSYAVWVRGRDFYDEAWVVHILVGESGRHGCNAAVPMGMVALTLLYIAAVGMEYLGPFKEPVLPLHWVAGALIAVGLAALAAAYSLLLFMWPRFLAPPHLRDKRGWIPQAWHQWRSPDGQHTTSSQ